MATKIAPIDRDTKPTVKAPTPKEFEKGAKVTLKRPGWTNHEQVFHGIAYQIVFDGNDEAVIIKDHYDLWIGPDRARKDGITVTPVK